MNPPPGPGPGPGPIQSPFTPPPVGSYVGQTSVPRSIPASSEAVAALVCGILSWTCFPLGFLALFLGVRARRAARQDPDRVGGEQLALVGMILGGFFGVCWLLFWLIYAAAIVFAIGVGALHK